jgi:hypothetical protein
MDATVGTLLGACIAGGAGVITAYVINRQQGSIAREAHIQMRRTQRYEYRLGLLKSLVVASQTVEALHGRFDTTDELEADKQAKREYAEAVGQAIAICKAADDDKMKKLGENMTPYLVPDFKNVNRNNIHEALEILAAMITQEISDE